MEWIDVKDGKPNFDTPVWLCLQSDKQIAIVFALYSKEMDDFIDLTYCQRIAGIMRITHYQIVDLPTPPISND